jgi:L,D-peptidoglycan transpeptidase YkuD (ErfK/YbiS/YcfS/YnhG family)
MRRLLPLALAACTMPPAQDPLLAEVPAGTTQVVVVGPSHRGAVTAELTAWQRSATGWTLALGPLPAVVGRTGVVAAADKREGDGHTPGGVFAIGTAFGYEASLRTGLAYRQATAADHWIDDPASPQYNQWVVGKPAVSAERMRRDDDAYSAGAVVEYNTQPVVPGRGSAIFLHVWSGPGRPTAGCVAAAGDDVRAVLAFLHRDRSPVIAIAVE